MSSTLIVLAVIVVVVLWAISVYNGLVSMRQRVNQAFADIDVQLKQRHDLVPNLVETVKGYAAHERGTLDEVVKARNAAVTAQGPAQQAAAENMLSGALRQLFALSESYPDLKASANFQQLLIFGGSRQRFFATPEKSSCRPDRPWRRRRRERRRVEAASAGPFDSGHLAAAFSTCPPNWKRKADSSLSWKSDSPRELKRS